MSLGGNSVKYELLNMGKKDSLTLVMLWQLSVSFPVLLMVSHCWTMTEVTSELNVMSWHKCCGLGTFRLIFLWYRKPQEFFKKVLFTKCGGTLCHQFRIRFSKVTLMLFLKLKILPFSGLYFTARIYFNRQKFLLFWDKNILTAGPIFLISHSNFIKAVYLKCLLIDIQFSQNLYSFYFMFFIFSLLG